MGSLMIFYIGVTLIAFIVDKMLLDTYPAVTLISIIIFFTNVAMRLYENKYKNKIYDEFKKSRMH